MDRKNENEKEKEERTKEFAQTMDTLGTVDKYKKRQSTQNRGYRHLEKQKSLKFLSKKGVKPIALFSKMVYTVAVVC